MTPIQQMLLAATAPKKTYMDDIFSNYLWDGNNTDRTITNNIDLKGKGGMVWVKKRTADAQSVLADTERDDPSLTGQKYIKTESSDDEASDTNGVKYFYNTGFSTGSGGHVNANSHKYISYSFRKAEGFFDVIKYTGNGTAGRQIAHSLNSIPGCIMVKCISTNGTDWRVYHRSVGNQRVLTLNGNGGESGTNSAYWNNADPTATHFTVGSSQYINANNEEFIAYVFAGGESTAATARSVKFDGNGDTLYVAGGNSFDFGANDFTIECWVKPTDIAYSSYYKRMWSFGDADGNSICALVTDTGTVDFRINNSGVISSSSRALPKGIWTHVAVVRESNVIKLYLNGTKVGSAYSYTSTIDYSQGSEKLWIGTQINNASSSWYGSISNFRVVKGTAVYTTDFKPSTTPLTNITNTVVLCCNDSSTTGATVTPNTISANGSAAANTDSPFDDPAGYVFGDNEDQNTIACNSYTGNGNDVRQKIYLGWQPQWVLIKRLDSSEDWTLYDSMRGIALEANDVQFKPNHNYDDITGIDRIELAPDGFTIKTTDGDTNADDGTYAYVCIRSQDGYVSKPANAATDVFNIAAEDSTLPAFNANFPVDLALFKVQTNTDWRLCSRQIHKKYLNTNTRNAASDETDKAFDYSDGWNSQANYSNGEISWMWKRGKGMDCVSYIGDGLANHSIPHSLGSVPEMMWIKRPFTNNEEWLVYHKGVNGGTNPEQYYIMLHSSANQSDSSTPLADTAPTSTHFTVGTWGAVNGNGSPHMAFLFTSVTGISKVGYYTGTAGTHSITLGFQPRFVIVKNTTDSEQGWFIFDTTRGWGSGDDQYMRLNETYANAGHNYGAPTSTGFEITSADGGMNASGSNYIYYAHA